MKYCVPITCDLGWESIVCEHFGSAPHFALIEMGNGGRSLEVLENENAGHAHGHCNPVRTLMRHDPGAAVVSGIGRRALALLDAMNVTVFLSSRPTLAEIADEIAAGTLEPIKPALACDGHRHDHHHGQRGHH